MQCQRIFQAYYVWRVRINSQKKVDISYIKDVHDEGGRNGNKSEL